MKDTRPGEDYLQNGRGEEGNLYREGEGENGDGDAPPGTQNPARIRPLLEKKIEKEDRGKETLDVPAV